MSAPSLTWYVRRLRRMAPDEIAGRTRDAVRRLTWARRQVRPGTVGATVRGTLAEREFTSPLPETARAEIAPELVAGVVAAADTLLEGSWTLLGVTRTDLADPDWFFDPVTGRRAPDTKLAFRVHHRDENETGNVKQVWELSRHHHLTVLATAYWLTHDERYAEAVADQLRSWWRANPFLTGVHWTSGIEVGVRLLAWTWTRRLLADWPKVGDLFEHDEDAVAQIGWHQEFLAGFPSRGSSANNHLVAEAAGRVAAACAFPWYDRSEAWRRQASDSLVQALATNTLDDGVNAELASGYHRFVIELALVAAVEADVAGHPLPTAAWTRIAAMLDAGAATLDATGRAPRQGDGDEGRALVLDPGADPWVAALGAGATLLPAPAWWPTMPASLQATLLGALSVPRFLPRPSSAPRWFADAGMALLRSAPQDGAEIWCRCDGGPHGFSSIAAHAHADALSLEVRHDGVDILADPGTYCYHGDPEWREWCRSTAAHNTLQVDGVDQSLTGGPFMWTTHATAQTVACTADGGPVQSWSAEHDGYHRLETPVTHRRSAVLDSPARRLSVTDTVEPVAEGPAVDRPGVDVVATWQLGPDVDVQLVGARAELSWDVTGETRRATLDLAPELSWSAHRGETGPVRGWYAPRFGDRVPATLLAGHGSVSATTTLRTTLELP